MHKRVYTKIMIELLVTDKAKQLNLYLDSKKWHSNDTCQTLQTISVIFGKGYLTHTY